MIIYDGIKMKRYAINFFHFLVSKAETAMTDKFQRISKIVFAGLLI